MSVSHTRSEDALRAAQLYYLQDLNMDAVAREMNLSRSSVSRLISYARESGLVQITVTSPQEAMGDVAHRIADAYGLVAHIVPTPPRATEAERLERTALSAARILAVMADSNTVIGIAWGATVSAVGRQLPTKTLHNVHVVQMNGAANTHSSGVAYAGAQLERFGQAFGAEIHHFSVPALFDDPLTKQAMWRERSVRSILDIQRNVNLFVFGVGSPAADVPSHVYAGEYVTAADLRSVVRDGVVGDCATRFFRADGSSDGIALNERSSGPEFTMVRQIPHRLCVVSSMSKLDALRGALNAGLVTELVVEESVARALAEPRR
ncbi:sugar-binding transcriptional regulator [Microbacterium sp. No. 7]|uniref:sugar-binding transcriptional regulator n=1 Tax=Microbacterium sp. No. 7 TaxID=1714373 RepID=UPI0006D258D0|nr:sugar-binding domain-containing protein [Microbacterium sp. No. 7]